MEKYSHLEQTESLKDPQRKPMIKKFLSMNLHTVNISLRLKLIAWGFLIVGDLGVICYILYKIVY